MKVEGGSIVIDVDELALLGPYCTAKEARLGDRAPSITRAISWCYADWRAQQRMDDDGMAQRVWS